MKFVKFYVQASVMFLNFVLFLVVINLAILAWRKWTNATHFPRADQLTTYFNADASPVRSEELPNGFYDLFDNSGMTEVPAKETYQTLIEHYQFSNSGLIFRPWVGFTSTPYSGKYLNFELDPVAFSIRRTVGSKESSGKKKTIFIFGGSTTFGFPVSDEQTWPSYLAKKLNEKSKTPVEVINFGNCAYYSSQEVALAQRLFKFGKRPDLVIFMDGVNEDGKNFGPSGKGDEPEYSDMVADAFSVFQDNSLRGDWRRLNLALQSVPLLQALHPLMRMRQQGPPPPPLTEQENDAIGDRMFNRYEANLRMMEGAAKAFGVKTLFFLQPDGLQNYPVELFPHGIPNDFMAERRKHVQFFARAKGNRSIHSLENLFTKWGANKKALVDRVHYTPAFNQFLAEEVATYIRE